MSDRRQADAANVIPVESAFGRARKAIAARPWLAAAALAPAAVCFLACGGVAYYFAAPAVPKDADAAATAQVRDVTVAVQSVRVGSFGGVSPGGHRVFSNDQRIVITLLLTNGNNARRAEYGGWHGQQGVRLHDDLGNVYSGIELKADTGFTSRIDGQHPDGATIYADKPLTDVLVFERPVPGANRLYLTLPAARLGGLGKIKLRIDRETWQPKKEQSSVK